MSNFLSFVSAHRSLSKFETIELPNFVVLTGRNGSGKTHLLTGIVAGKISSSLVSDVTRDVRLFDSTTIIPKDTGIFDPSQEHSRRSQWFNIIETQREQVIPNLQAQLIAIGIPAEYCNTTAKINSLDAETLTKIVPDPNRVVEMEQQIQSMLINSSNQIYANAHNQIGDDGWRKASVKVQQRDPKLFLRASRSTFFEDKDFLWGEIDPFQQAFGRIFTNYRDLIHANDRLEKYPPPDEPTRKYLTESEFIGVHGTPPWDFVNAILSSCLLDFRVDHPPLHEVASYEPKLRKLTGNVTMRFEDLSSGEKVLMSFALCLYNTQDTRQTSVFPKLLLLDEVDAPLHPSMAASLIKTIQDVLVRDKNVAVILTTHSPSTVALAPEESIFSMNPLGPKIEKISKGAALSILSTGVPTLSVSFDGRRQVFVESRTDAYIYDVLYQRFKSKIKSDRSLVFVQVGHSATSGGEHNAGCAQVIRLVNTLSLGGNQTVYGLIDWDGENSASERVHVLAPGIRDGLESVLLDPALLVALVVRENSGRATSHSIIINSENYFSLKSWDVERWQIAVNHAQRIVFPMGDFSDVVEISYLKGFTIRILREYLYLDDHALEDRILEAFPFLKPRARKVGELMSYVIDTVLSELPELLPNDLIRTFEKLLESPYPE